MPGRKRKSGEAYRLKVTLIDIEPPIWRRIMVPSHVTLEQLHHVLQVAMGWTDTHLHVFEIDGASYGPCDPDDPWLEDITDERRVRLDQVIRGEGASFGYEYDMGDGWQHLVALEAIVEDEPDARHPVCIEGERSCPPEDCGGWPGYEGFLEAIGDPDHPEHDELREWAGDSFDPEAFDLKTVNRLLRHVM